MEVYVYLLVLLVIGVFQLHLAYKIDVERVLGILFVITLLASGAASLLAAVLVIIFLLMQAFV